MMVGCQFFSGPAFANVKKWYPPLPTENFAKGAKYFEITNRLPNAEKPVLGLD